MAKKFTAADLLKIANGSDKAQNEVERIMDKLVGFADRGLTAAYVDVEGEFRGTVKRELENAGFKVENRGDQFSVSWKESHDKKSLPTPPSSETPSAAPNATTIVGGKKVEKKSQTDRKAENSDGKNVTHHDKKSLPTPPSSETPNAAPNATTIVEGKKVEKKSQTDRKAENSDGKNVTHHHKNRGGVNGCVFNINMPITINIEIHHFTAKRTAK